MKTIPIQMKAEGFGPLIFRTKDKVTHFYQYYSCMERMGDEHHDLHLVVEDEFFQDDVVLHSSGIISKCLGFNIDAVYLESGQLWKKDCKKLIATTNVRVHESSNYKIPLISEEIIRNYAYEDQNGGLKEVILETEEVCETGSHCRYGSMMMSNHKCKSGCMHPIKALKLNEDGEVIMYHEPVKIVDWNIFSIEELIAHLEETFKFDSSGTAKAVHELIAAYRNKQEPNICVQTGKECGYPCGAKDGCQPLSKHKKTNQELEDIFDDCARKNMIVWNLSGFKQSYRKLFKSIIESLKIASNGGN